MEGGREGGKREGERDGDRQGERGREEEREGDPLPVLSMEMKQFLKRKEAV